MESSAAHVQLLSRLGAGLMVVAVILLAAIGDVEPAATGGRFRLCVAVDHFEVCRRLTSDSGLALDCVAGNDRLDCLRKVQSRDADFLAVDPEDVYVALQMDNTDFGVFAEVRTLEEPAAEFRYEGIVLVRRADGFKSMADLRGKKSCHTGYGRNVGYKIPITKLRRLDVFKMPATNERHQSPVEHELAGLSELFRSSCLVGRYSPDADFDRVLKKRYANLCALCAQPDECAANDRYSGYEGAIRCLVENGGDVAFTKTNFVRRYFGLPLSPGGLAKPAVNPAARPEDYVFLCENGNTQPVTDQLNVCSWAQRPWPALMGNGDLTGAGRMAELQAVLQAFYRHYTREPAGAVSAADREAAHLLGLDRRHLIVDQRRLVPPAEYLTRAYYTDVIERETPYDFRIRLCVVSEQERQKCVQMQRAAYARDVRPAFECVLKTAEACAGAVVTGDVDAVVLKDPPSPSSAAQLKPVVWEVLDDVMWAIADKGLSPDQLRVGPVAYDPADKRAVAAAEALRAKRPSLQLVPEASQNGTSGHTAPIRIVSSRTLAHQDAERHTMLCRDHRLEPLSATGCNLDRDDDGNRRDRPVARVYIRRGANETTQDSIVHAFTALSDAFGRGKRHERVFQLFGPFRLLTPPDQQVSDLIFHDYATALAAPPEPDA
ncbi:transferrin [Anopheles bellator]|uniref:transferrin n=1 Tax=Anopheles bellator TaxID=139047 RepID=UPI00264707CB|nr:transferrin [Anopheles bellator]